MTVGQGPGIARGPPAARLGSRRPSLGRHSAHPGLSSTLFCRLLRLSSNASMRTNVFFCLWDSFISQEFLYSLPVSKGYLDPLGCVRSSDTPAAQSTHGKWVLAHACQNSTAEPWRHKQGWPWQRWPHGDPPSEFPWSLLTRPCPAVFRPGSIPGSGRSPGEGNGNPLQYSCLENPMDAGSWWATLHGVTKSRTGLSEFTFTFFMTLSTDSVGPAFCALPRSEQLR